jgi:hypothetical protein
MVDVFPDSFVVGVVVGCQLLLFSHSLFSLKKGYPDEVKPMRAIKVG